MRVTLVAIVGAGFIPSYRALVSRLSNEFHPPDDQHQMKAIILEEGPNGSITDDNTFCIIQRSTMRQSGLSKMTLCLSNDIMIHDEVERRTMGNA